MTGTELYWQRNYVEARRSLEREFAETGDPAIGILLAAAKARTARNRMYVDEALRSWNALFPENDGVLSLVGEVLWDLGFHEDGARKMRRAIALNPNDWNLYACACRFDKEETYAGEALGYIHQRLVLKPVDSLAYLGRGCVYAKWGFVDLAERDYRRAIEIDPKEPGAHYDLANLLALQEQYQDALGEFQSAVCLKYWNLHMAHAGVALCLLKLGRLHEARDQVKESLKVMPDYAYAVELLAEIEQKLNLEK